MHVVIPSSIINGIAILVGILNRYVGWDDKQIGVAQ
jgi:hypothetical protein